MLKEQRQEHTRVPDIGMMEGHHWLHRQPRAAANSVDVLASVLASESSISAHKLLAQLPNVCTHVVELLATLQAATERLPVD